MIESRADVTRLFVDKGSVMSVILFDSLLENPGVSMQAL